MHPNVLVDIAQVDELLAKIRRVAILGARPARFSWKPAYYVPEALQQMGLEVVPVSVHGEIPDLLLGSRVYYTLAEIPGEFDLVNVFRRSEDLPGHFDDILARRPAFVWLQSGIRNDRFANRLAEAGIHVVQDRCLMVDYRRWQQKQSL